MIFDWTYLVIVLPAVFLAMLAQWKVKSTFARYDKMTTARSLTGYEAARLILNVNGLSHIAIEHVQGELTDHYDPRAGVIRLSDSTYANSGIAAIGIAAHETGHAIQYASGYLPIKLRTAIIPVTNIGSNLAMPLVLLGLILSMPPLSYLGIFAFGFSTLFQLITLPVEYDASNRAAAILSREGLLTPSEIDRVKKVLSAAALTYVAALAVSLANLLRLMIIVERRKK